METSPKTVTTMALLRTGSYSRGRETGRPFRRAQSSSIYWTASATPEREEGPPWHPQDVGSIQMENTRKAGALIPYIESIDAIRCYGGFRNG